jgi:hypothetical protein
MLEMGAFGCSSPTSPYETKQNVKNFCREIFNSVWIGDIRDFRGQLQAYNGRQDPFVAFVEQLQSDLNLNDDLLEVNTDFFSPYILNKFPPPGPNRREKVVEFLPVLQDIMNTWIKGSFISSLSHYLSSFNFILNCIIFDV